MRVLIVLAVVLQATLAFAAESWVQLTPRSAPFGEVIASDPFAPDTLYAGVFAKSGMAKSTDGGRTWTMLSVRPKLLRQIVVERSGPNRITALSWDDTDYTLFRSIDGGMSWTARGFRGAITGMIAHIAVDPVNTNIIYAAHERSCVITCIADSGGISRSTDGGRNWSALFKGIGIERVLVDPFGSGTVYAAGHASRRSDNGGATWSTLPDPNGQSIHRIAVDPVVPNVIYASTLGGVWRSDDRGDHWQKLGDPFGNGLMSWSLAVDPANRNVIVAGGGNGWGAKRSTDGGATWQAINDGLHVPGTVSQLDWIDVTFAANGTLYAAGGFLGALTLQPPAKGPRARSVRK